MNKAKKISAVFMVLALVLCTGYFSVMSPTTAWFYQSQSVNGSNNKFVFADFSVDGEYSFDRTIKFDAATKFEDPDETMFDSAVKTVDVEVKNDNSSKGLRYFYYTDDMVKDGSLKAAMTNALGGKLSDEALNIYNVGTDGNSGHYVMLNPGESKTVKVALWVEYDESGAENAFLDSGWNTVDYSIKITMTATQDSDGAMVR